MKINAASLPVMKAVCVTCPFKLDKKGRYRDPQLVATVIERTLLKGHQICHGTKGKNREPKNRCKGAFDYNMVIYERLGYKHLVK